MQRLLLDTRNSASSRYSAWWSWWSPLLRVIALAIAVGVAYFFVAQLSLALLTKPDGVAVFWPAAGIASGTLIALGFGARLPVILGVVTATIAANLLGDRNLAAGLVFALCNAGESLLVAWLITRYFGEAFRLESLRSVLGFFAAAAVGPAISGIAATVGFIQFHSPDAPVLTIWLNWFVSDALGIIMVAPLLIGIGALRHDLPQRWELCEGMATLAALAIVAAIAFGAPAQYWYTVLPLGLLLPVLLAAHCWPVFAAAAALVLGFAVVWTTTFAIGDLGELPSLQERTYAGRATLLAISICTLVLAALFAERRQKEAALEDRNDRLKDSNGRLQLALDCAELGTWSLDLESGRFENDGRDRHIHGHGPDTPPQSLAQMRSQVHPDDLPNLDGAFAGLVRAGGSCRTEYRLLPRTDQERADRERWVAIEGAVVRDAAGRPVQLLGVTRDISERKRTEADLAERRAQLAVFVEHAPAAIAMFDREMRYLAVSRRFVVDFRLPQTAQLIGRSHHEVFPDIPQRWRDVHARVLAGEELSQEEDQFARQDGRIDWVRWSMVPWRRADGNIGGALLFSELRTEQVEARRALIDSEARFRATFENAAVGVVLVSTDGSIVRANNSYARMLGYSVEELEARTFQDLTHPDDLATNLSVLNKALVGEAESYSMEKRYVRKDGGIVWASLSVGCVRKTDGVVDYFVSVVADITDRKRAEARLAERNEQLDLAGKIARIGSFMYDDGTRKLQLSPGCAAIYGLPEGTLEISREDWRTRVHPDDLSRLDAVARRAFTNGEREFVLEFRIFRHGQVRWIESRVLISYNEAGKPVRRMGAEIDVTERKHAEKALAERNLQLSLAGKSARVGSYAYNANTDAMQIDAGYAALHGLPEGTAETTRSEWRARAHPEDLVRIENMRSRAFRERWDEYDIEYRIVRSGGEGRWIESRSFISYATDGHPERVVGVNIDITERKHAEDQQRLLVAELDHRVKNVLATVSAVAAQTSGASSSLEHFVSAFDGRLRSMAQTHELLSERLWRGIPLAELLRRELAPYAGGNNTEIGGPEVILTAEAGQTLAMVFHELATNAAKHGAFSSREGKVSVDWRRQLNGTASAGLVIEWRETGSAPAKAESKAGYGISVICELIPHELAGKVNHALTPEGARCQLELPGRWIDAGSTD